MLCECMFQRTKKRRQGKNLNEQSCDQFNLTTTIFLKCMNFQKYIKIYMKSSYCKDTPSKHMRRQKRKLKKTPNFFILKRLLMSWSEWIHNEFIPWASSLCLYIYKHIYTYLYKIFVSFQNMRIFARLLLLLFNFLNTLVRGKIYSKVQILLPPINISNK